MYEIQTNVNLRDWDAVTRSAVQNTARNITELGRANILGAGGFTKRQANALNFTVKRTEGGWFIDLKFRRLGFLKIFEYGGTVRPRRREFLWLPAEGGMLAPMKIRNYPGKLFRPGPKGNKRNVLMGRDRKVKYIGVPSVTLPKRFDLRNIAYNEAARFLEFFKSLGS